MEKEMQIFLKHIKIHKPIQKFSMQIKGIIKYFSSFRRVKIKMFDNTVC